MRSEYAVRNARNALAMMGARAQATALEMGENVCVDIDPTAGEAIMRVDASGEIIEALRYDGDPFRADLATTSGEITVCYTVRGFAKPAANLPDTVTFTFGQATARAVVHALGDIEPI